MYEQVAVVAGAVGVLLAPLVVGAARVVPTLRRRRVNAGATGDSSGEVLAESPAPVHPSGGALAVVPKDTTLGPSPETSAHIERDGRRHLVVAGVATGIVLAVFGGRLGLDLALPAYAVFGVVAVTLALVDGKHHRLPDVLTLPSYAVGVVLLAVARLAGSDSGSLARALLGAFVAFALFAAMYLAKPAGIGAGDVKYAGVVGLYTAWLGWGSLVVALFGGFVIGAVVSLALLVIGRAGRRTRVPFGPSMVAGAVLAIGWGEAIAATWVGA